MPRVLRFTTPVLQRRALLASWLGLAACSADAVSEPAPTLETLGAFVARADEPDGSYRLYRVLYVLRVMPTDPTLFLTVYAVTTETPAEARDAAQHGPLPLVTPVQVFSANQFASVPHEVVWFRSLTEEERQRAL